jgi:uncharacterized protein (TIGR00251 family)
MIELQQTEGGVIVPVRARPKARRNAIAGTHAGRLRIAVTDPPEKGNANRSIAELLAAALNVAPARVQLVAGSTSPIKKFLVTGLSLETVRDLLNAQADEAQQTPRSGPR